jgi:transcriptional regulator with XRE-family HTH domain
METGERFPMDFRIMSDKAIQAELAGRLQKERLNRNLSQADLAQRSGISLRTLKYVEGGRDSSLETLIRILRALDRLDHLNAFLPESGPSPLQLARMKGKERKHASGRRGKRRPARS